MRRNIKLELIGTLLKSGLTVDEILSLSTKKALSPEGVKSGKKLIPLQEAEIKLLGEYVKRYKGKIGEYLFPSLRGGQLSRNSFLIGFKHFVLQRGESLADYDITTTRARKPKVELDNMQAILDFLK